MGMRLRRHSLLNAGEVLIQEYSVTAGNILVDLTSTGMAFMPDVVQYESDFSADLDGWTLFNETGGATATWTFDTDHGVLAVTGAGSSSLRPMIQYVPFNDASADFYYTLSVNYTVNSGTCILKDVMFGDDVVTVTDTFSGTDIYELTQQRDPNSTGKNVARLYFNGTNTFNLSIHSITITKHPAKTYLEPYAGNDTDSTPYRMVLVDGSANEASFFVGGPGGGEAFNVAEVDDDCADDGTADWDKLRCTATFDTDHYNINFASLTGQWFDKDGSVSLDIGKIYKASYSAKNGTLSNINVRMYIASARSTSVYLQRSTQPTFTAYEFYHTPAVAYSNFGFYTLMPGAGNIQLKGILLHSLSDVPATGVHAITERNGSTRGFTSIDAGFDPNSISVLKVYEL